MAVKRLNFADAPTGSIDALQRSQIGIGYPFVLTGHPDYCLPVTYTGAASIHPGAVAAYPAAANTHPGAPAGYPGTALQIEHCLQN